MRSPFQRVIGGAAIAVVIAGGIIGGPHVLGGSGGGGPAGNVYLTTSGNDGTCVRGDVSHPCLTPGGAWSIASSGDTISVGDGTYSSGCTLSGNKTSTTTFTGTSTTLAKFACDLNMNVNFVGVTNVGLYQFGAGGNNITFTNVDTTCVNSSPYTLYAPDNKCSARWSISGNDFTWTGGSTGPFYDSEVCPGGNGPNISLIGIASQPTNVTITNVYFHDVTTGCGNTQHTELLRIDGGSNITLDRVFWTGIGNSAALFISNQSGTVPSNITISNNICDGTGLGGQCVDYNAGATAANNVVLKNNTFLSGVNVDTATTISGTNFVIANTIWLGANPCPLSTVTYRNNAPYQPSSGGTTDRCNGDTNQIGVGTQSGSSSPPVAWLACGSSCTGGGLGVDYTVKASSPLLHTGSATYMPSTDYAGTARPCSGQSVPNVGAYETRCS